MRKYAEVTKTAQELSEALNENFKKFTSVNGGAFDKLATDSYDNSHEAVGTLIENAHAIVAGVSDSEGIAFPHFLTSYKTYGEGTMTSVVVTIKSKLKDPIKYKKVVDLDVQSESFVSDFVTAFTKSAFEMFYRHEVEDNLSEINELIEKLCAENSIPYTFGFTVSDSSAYVTEITDDKVIFNASLESALDVSKLGLFCTGDSYYDFVREQQTDKLINDLKAVPTTVQLIKARIDLIETLVGFKTKKRADSLIRKSYHKQAKYFNKVRAGLGYVEKELADGTQIFAILEKSEGGEISVALSPFDVKTMAVVDYDVVADIKAELAE